MAGADWRSIARDGVAARAAEAKPYHASQYANISRVGFSVAVHPFVVQAAKRRGISISGYIRRSTLGHAAMDLGLDVVDLLALDAAVRTPDGSRPTHDLDGAVFGTWGVRPA